MPVKKLPEKLKANAFCPGCGHGTILRLIAEAVEELELNDNKCLVLGVGCSCNGNGMLGGDDFQCAHGRAAAVAVGMKRFRPGMCVFTYQGDGDAGVIGLAETLNAAYRNEKITVFVVNNTNFGMTGGQMSWTTLPGQKTTTSVRGRDCSVTGAPIHLPELIATQFDVAYAARASVHDVKHITQAKKMVLNALQAQMNEEGYSIVEFLSSCPTNWHLSPIDSNKFIAEQVLAAYPVGEFKSRKGKEGQA
ncbi:MAG: 2-oxoglutarate oxidoreductase [Oscillospiraceae bacterium]|nr:2-oxoglutarate oxidoreductase [Oscillospiraceae bacterium]